MVALIQRVTHASVEIEGNLEGSIQAGLLIFLGVHRTDTEKEIEWLAHKTAHLRIFPDDDGKMNRSLMDVGAEALVVSQFTLYGDATRGHRPSFIESAPPEMAEPIYRAFIQALKEQLGRPVSSGRFGAMMQVELNNDGPVTIWLERRATESA